MDGPYRNFQKFELFHILPHPVPTDSPESGRKFWSKIEIISIDQFNIESI